MFKDPDFWPIRILTHKKRLIQIRDKKNRTRNTVSNQCSGAESFFLAAPAIVVLLENSGRPLAVRPCIVQDSSCPMRWRQGRRMCGQRMISPLPPPPPPTSSPLTSPPGEVDIVENMISYHPNQYRKIKIVLF